MAAGVLCPSQEPPGFNSGKLYSRSAPAQAGVSRRRERTPNNEISRFEPMNRRSPVATGSAFWSAAAEFGGSRGERRRRFRSREMGSPITKRCRAPFAPLPPLQKAADRRKVHGEAPVPGYAVLAPAWLPAKSAAPCQPGSPKASQMNGTSCRGSPFVGNCAR